MHSQSQNQIDVSQDIGFDSEKRIKIVYKIFAFFFGSVLLLFNIIFTFIVSIVLHDIAKLSPSAVFSIAVVIFLFGLYYCWKLIRRKLRFCIIFTTQRMQIGRGWAKCLFDYDNVDLITVLPNGRDNCIKLQCGKESACVFLPTFQIPQCVDLLREYCTNTMYVDSSGQEYYPQNPTHPEKTLSVLERYYRKKGVVVFLSVIFLSVILIFWGTYEFMLWRKGGINPAILDRNQLIKMITAAPLLIISISGAFISAWKSWQRANGIRSRRIQFQDEFRNKY